jgi:hypothetical protein
VTLAERLCRPQRVGVFGQRGVGKTTLLTMLYREAVGGRLPELRLAAADARTANYLSDKVLQLEAGHPLPATLGETELRFHLYHRGCRLDLLVKDYQGEHVAVGRHEPIRDFLRDCDVVWLCLDGALAAAGGSCIHAEQEVEQVVEDYLADDPHGGPHRPMALVVTKADLLEPARSFTGPDADRAALGVLVDRCFNMTWHALATHSPQHDVFAVSALGAPLTAAPDAPAAPFTPKPAGLAQPLSWLAAVLQGQDEARLNHLWQTAANNVPLLRRCVAAFARRYPDALATKAFQARLQALQRRRTSRRILAGVASAACLLLALAGYDAFGASAARRFAAENEADPVAVRANWQTYQNWHPTRHLLRPAASRAERAMLQELDATIRAQECQRRLADVRRLAADPDADPEEVWQQFQAFRTDYPEHNVADDQEKFRDSLKARRDAERERRARNAFDDLNRAEQRTELAEMVAVADRFLRDHVGTSYESEVRGRRRAYLQRLDEKAIEVARHYSRTNPLNFHTRRQRYQEYLERHPAGAFVAEATEAQEAIERDWDKYDFRAVRDHFQAHPADTRELDARCRSYLAAHPRGRFRDSATELLRWSERVTAVGEYRVKVVSGDFSNGTAAFFSRGPSMSVEFEVNGVRYGPSTIVKRRYDPDWDYEFPMKVRWKLGDSVHIRVTDNYYWKRTVFDVPSDDDDRLALRLLSGTVHSGPNSVTFESDFAMPKLPKIE